ncbi:MAG: phosphatidylserine decarboxylase family protein [Bacteroidota bacterium]|mgnify:CR=1 FL=1|jgi:phosphatidylserine decarboxylase|nr:phosphatidylserine decarboxylase family protein [Bacteroidota bacterium]HHU96908.1 phosphatidylserine decarboxylase family protein [Petrimonas sp.]
MLRYIHKEGKPALAKMFIVLLILNGVLLLCLPSHWLPITVLAISIVLFAITLYFYRQPRRVYQGELHGLVNTPTDGKVVVIEKVFEKQFFNEERIQVSIFMSLFNAHANWVPVSGKITHLSHVAGNFWAAYLPKSSHENEHTNIVIETLNNGSILTKQIAGAIARRIVTYVSEGEEVTIGSQLGFIKLGSRMDIFLPVDSEIMVKLGEQVRANVTVLARLPEVKSPEIKR